MPSYESLLYIRRKNENLRLVAFFVCKRLEHDHSISVQPMELLIRLGPDI